MRFSEFGIVREYQEDRKTVVVDTERATFRYQPWKTLNRFYRKKFDNRLFLSEPENRLRIVYETPWGLCWSHDEAANRYYYKNGY